MANYSRVARVAAYLAAIDTLTLPAANDNEVPLGTIVYVPPTVISVAASSAFALPQWPSLPSPIWVLRAAEVVLAALIILFFL